VNLEVKEKEPNTNTREEHVKTAEQVKTGREDAFSFIETS
jgi:hypothetical protein